MYLAQLHPYYGLFPMEPRRAGWQLLKFHQPELLCRLIGMYIFRIFVYKSCFSEAESVRQWGTPEQKHIEHEPIILVVTVLTYVSSSPTCRLRRTGMRDLCTGTRAQGVKLKLKPKYLLSSYDRPWKIRDRGFFWANTPPNKVGGILLPHCHLVPSPAIPPTHSRFLQLHQAILT